MLTAGGPLPLVESGTGTCQKVQECNEAILIAGDKSTGQAIEPNTLSELFTISILFCQVSVNFWNL